MKKKGAPSGKGNQQEAAPAARPQVFLDIHRTAEQQQQEQEEQQRQSATPDEQHNPGISVDGCDGTSFMGRIVIELANDVVPKTCENFKQLCAGATVGDKKSKDPKQVSYKGCRFLRVTADGMQTGDVLHRPDGKGQESIYGPLFDDEQVPVTAIPHQLGVVSMCNSGPNTNGCQFFICHPSSGMAPPSPAPPAGTPLEAAAGAAGWGQSSAALAHMNAHHVSFGQVVQGLELLSLMRQVLEEHAEQHGAVPEASCPLLIGDCGVHNAPAETPKPQMSSR